MQLNNENSQSTKIKLLDPKIDAVFQILFSKSNPEVIKGLLSAILNVPINHFINNTVNLDLNKILDRSYPTDKIGVLDVRAQINNEIEIDLEMQMVYQDMLLERILWYWAKLYASQLKSGDDYSSLKKTLEILIVNDNIPSLKNILKPCTKWQIREHEILSEILTDNFEIVIIELPKVEQAYFKNKDSLLLQWMMFLLNPESLEVSKIMQENENIKIATKELEQISEDEVNQYIAELREKARRDDAALLSTGKRLGREELQAEVDQYVAEIKEQTRKDHAALLSEAKRIAKEGIQKDFEEYIAALEERTLRDHDIALNTGKRLGREEAQKEIEQFKKCIAELQENARKNADALDTAKRIGREEAQKEIEEQFAELEETTNKIVTNLLSLNFTFKQISEITGLSIQKIEDISNQ